MSFNILVTGGAGYIGAHFINKLSKNPAVNIFVVDNFSQGKNNIIKKNNIQYYDVDVRNKEKLNTVIKDNTINIVAHFAALASVPDSVSRPSEYYSNNVIGGLNLLDCMIENDVNRIIFSSSASVYGEPITEEIDESHPKNPTSPYGYTKLFFENALKDYNRAYGLKSISFRYFCAAGCDESGLIGEYHNPETHVIPSIIKTLFGERKEFFVYGDDYATSDGTGIRDYIHVNDLADAHILAIDKLSSDGDICNFYNLGINKGFSVLELIKAAESVSGNKLKYEIRNRRPGDPSRLIANSTLAQQELGWKPQYLDIKKIIHSAYLKKYT